MIDEQTKAALAGWLVRRAAFRETFAGRIQMNETRALDALLTQVVEILLYDEAKTPLPGRPNP